MGGLLEDVGDLHEPFLLGYARKIGITVAGLALACERLQQILLRSCSLETLHQIPSLSIFIKRHPINAPGVVLLNVMTVIAYFISTISSSAIYLYSSLSISMPGWDMTTTYPHITLGYWMPYNYPIDANRTGCQALRKGFISLKDQFSAQVHSAF